MKACKVTVRMRDGSRITYGCIARTNFDACMAAYRRFWGDAVYVSIRNPKGARK